MGSKRVNVGGQIVYFLACQCRPIKNSIAHGIANCVDENSLMSISCTSDPLTLSILPLPFSMASFQMSLMSPSLLVYFCSVGRFKPVT